MINDALFAAILTLTEGPQFASKAAEVINTYTRQKMYRLWHIPIRYFLPGAGEGVLQKLVTELSSKGHIDLDSDGEPCCLSGKEPVLQENGLQ